MLHALARLLGVSDFLWDDFLRMQYANLFPVVRDVDALANARTRDQLAAELGQALAAAGGQDAGGAAEPSNWREILNAFKDREMFRVDMRHILGHIPAFGQFSAELTDLAEVVIAAIAGRCAEELAPQYGAPQTPAAGPLASACARWASAAAASWASPPTSS